MQSVWKEEQEGKRKFFENLIAHILGMAERIFFKFGMWPPWVEGISIVNLVPFELDITELQMRENRNFIVPVNIP